MFHRKNIFQWVSAIFLPAICILLMVYMVFTGFIIPELENTILVRTKKSIARMVGWSWNVLHDYNTLYTEGRMSLDEAKDRAKEHIRTMRYGSNSDDFFWIISFDHRLVMHPQMSDIESQELSDTTAFAGICYDDEIVEQAQKYNDGFLQYVESWKDEIDEKNIKIIYFKAFAPWEWIIGTSVMVPHVPSELTWLNQRLFSILSVALGLITLMIGIIISASYRLHRHRVSTDRALLENERYLRNLINSMDDFVFVVGKNGECKQCFSHNLNTVPAGAGNKEQRLCHAFTDKISELHQQVVKDIERTGGTQEHEYRLEINGSVLWFNSKISPLRNTDGFVVDYLWVNRNVTSQKILEDGLASLNHCFLSLGTDHTANIKTIVQTAGNIIGCGYTLYSRYCQDKGKLVVEAGWRVPKDFVFGDSIDGLICADLFISESKNPIIVEDISKTPYAQSDPCVVRYSLKSFAGYPVWLDDTIVGALCVYEQKKRDFTHSEKEILEMLAKALTIEEKRLQIENLRKDSEEQFRSMFDSAFDGIAICTLDGKFIDANRSLLEMTGFSLNEIRGFSLKDITPVQWHAYDTENMRTVNTHGSATYEKEFIRKDGSVFPVNITLWMIRDNLNNPVRMAMHICDLTDQKRTLEVLQVESARLFSVLESIPAFVYLVDCEFNVKFANKNFRDLFGDPEGKKCYELVVGSSTACACCAAREVLESGNSMSWEYNSFDGKSYMMYDSPFFDIDGAPLILEVGIDITGRKMAERALQQSRMKYRGIVDNIRIGIAIIDTNMSILSTNNRLKEWFSHIDDYEVILCRQESENPHKEDAYPESPVAETFKDGQVHEAVCSKKLHGKDKIEHFRIVASPLKDEKDEVTAAIVMVDNITDRLNTEKELRESEKRYRLLMESLIEGIWVFDARGYTTFVNEPMSGMLGYCREEMLGKHFYSFMNKLDRKVARKNLQNAKQGLRSINELKFLRKDGSRIFTGVNISSLFDDDGSYLGAIAGITDISKQKQADEEIKKFKKISDNANYGVVITDLEGNINYINNYFARMHGYSVEEFYGRHFSLFHVEKQMEQGHVIRKELMEKGSFSAVETERVASDGSKFIMLMNGVLIKDEEEKPLYIAVTAIDITDHKRMEEDLLKAMKLESVGILAGGIAHDFNNLLTAILGNVSLSLLDLDESHPLYQSLRHIEEASLRAKELSHQLLTFSKGGAPVKKITSIEELIRYAVKFSIKGAGITEEFYFDDGLHQVDIDKDQIIQVINNIALNAKEAMPEGILTIRAKNVQASQIHDVSLLDEEYVMISIEDRGYGIKPENMEKIFDPFFSTKDKASGLGLSTSYSIIKKHNGHITVESNVGKGTVVTIYLPAVKRNAPTVLNIKPSESKRKILVMDDEPVVRDILSRLLNRLGYETDCAEDGKEAVKLYKKAHAKGEPYEAVIMDLIIPHGMGGKDTIREILKINPTAKAIVSSGYCNDPIMSDYKTYGFSAVVNKPVSFDELKYSMMQILS